MMDNDAILLIVAIPVGYGALLIGLALLAHPSRLKMAALAESLLADPQFDEVARARVNRLVDTCMSFRVGLMLPLAALSVTLDEILNRHNAGVKNPLLGDTRFHELLGRYFASILAANPAVAVVSIPLMALGYVVHALKGDRNAREALEEPVMRASGVNTAAPEACPAF